MIIASEIAPSPALAPFVRCYTYREFDTGGMDLIKPWHASHEISMCFFFKAKPVELTDRESGETIAKGDSCGIVGLSTRYNGEMTFNGSYSLLEALFKPNGFYKIFRMPTVETANHIFNSESIFDSTVTLLFEQLANAKNVDAMTQLLEGYLLQQLKKQKWAYEPDPMTYTSALILRRRGLIDVDSLAAHANMSRRSFERHFREQVGISPKTFCCIARFNNALKLKLQRPDKEWTKIVFDAGYFDQMHLIKDFKRFTGSSPSDFLRHTPLTQEQFTHRVES